MSLRKSVILALGVIIVLAVAGGLIAYNFRSAMFDRKAAETVPAEGETGIEAPAASEDANTVESSSDNVPAAESSGEIEEEEPAAVLPAIESNETEEELSAIEETVSETPVIIPPVQEAADPAEEAVIDTADREAASDAFTKEYDILGYTLSARVEDGTVTLSYPDWVKADDAEAFFIHEDDEYNLSEKGMGKRTSISEFTAQNRGGKGVKCYKIMEKTGNVVGVKAINEDDEIMIINTEGIIIRMKCEGISLLGRITSGVKLINLPEGDKVASIAKVRKGDEEEEENDTESRTEE